MDRRRFLLTSLVSALAAPLATGAQQAAKMWRIGLLRPASTEQAGFAIVSEIKTSTP